MFLKGFRSWLSSSLPLLSNVGNATHPGSCLFLFVVSVLLDSSLSKTLVNLAAFHDRHYRECDSLAVVVVSLVSVLTTVVLVIVLAFSGSEMRNARVPLFF